MIADEYGEPVRTVVYHLMFRGERLDSRTDAKGAMQTVDRNPGMWLEAEIIEHDGMVSTTLKRSVVYGSVNGVAKSAYRVAVAS